MSSIVTPSVTRLVLVDFSWILHKSRHAYQNLSAVVDGITVPTGSLYGFVTLLNQLQKQFPDWTYVFALDAGRGGREKVYEWYKDNRSHSPDTKRTIPQIYQFLSYRDRAVLAEAPGYEADDVIGVFARARTSPCDIVIHSADNDMFQLVSDDAQHRVRIIRSLSAKEPLQFLGESDCLEKYGVDPKKLVLYRSLLGDDSDCIPPVMPRFRKALAVTLAGRYDAPRDVLKEVEFVNDQHRSLAEPVNLAAWERNFDVMSLRECVPVDVSVRGTTENDMRSVAERYNMKSMLKFL